MTGPLDRLRYHVSGAVERGEAEPIIGVTTTQETFTYWVCLDCYHAANGIDEMERGEPYPAGVLSLIPDTADVTAGLTAAEHAADCPVFPVIDDGGTRGEFDGSQECECETNTFSSSSCDGCGSALAGERFALTVWTETNGGLS